MDRGEWHEAYDDISCGCYWDASEEDIWFKYKNLPQVTLSAYTETGQAEQSIVVPKQRSYTGGDPVIPSSVANIPCAELGVSAMLDKLNGILGTSYTLETPSLCSLLGNFIANGSDFGIAYAYLRPVWHDDITDVEEKLRIRRERDRKMREDVLVHNKVISDWVPPRRVWDLYSNRVVPWWITRKWRSPISHAWMNDKDRGNVLTSINGYEWPAPIPKDANLDLVRIEMLNFGAEYTWLDALCLRQAYTREDNSEQANKEWKHREDLRREEWKVDVPTIGWVYKEGGRGGGRVIYYLNGLGRPLSSQACDFQSDRSWFRRAWTLQEISHDPIIGGVTDDDDATDSKVQGALEDRIFSLKKIWDGHVFMTLSEMQKRVSTNPVDRVAGLAYLLGSSNGIPAYYETQSEEDAWTALLSVLHNWSQGKLFFLYPEHGDGNNGWQPSWSQVMSDVLPSHYPSYGDIGRVFRTEERDADWCEGPCIESGCVIGLSKGSQAGNSRQGELVVEDGIRETWHLFRIVADHQYPIPDGIYTLIGSKLLDHHNQIQEQYWVVGDRLPEQRFKKVSVFRIPDSEEVKRLHDLGVATKQKIFLV